jgi:hypothetical protein
MHLSGHSASAAETKSPLVRAALLDIMEDKFFATLLRRQG